MLHYAILFTLFVTSHAWVLRTNKNEISPGSSKDVYLVCHWDDKSVEFDRLMMIRITKLNPFGSKIVYADYIVSTNDTSQLDDDVIVTSNVKTIRETFLKVIWPIASKTTAGSYGCEISGYDHFDSYVSHEVTPIVIKQKVLTEKELRQIIKETIQPIDKNHQSLKLEFANFKESLSTELDGLKRQNQNENAMIKRSIAKLKEDLEATFVTNDMFRDQISDVKNFTINEMISDNRKDETTHKNVYEAIQNIMESCRNNYTSVWSIQEDMKKSISKKMSLLEKNAVNVDARTKTKLETLSKALQTMDSKFENITDFLAVELKNHDCPCPRSIPSTKKPVTKTKTTQIGSEKWPSGLYSLVRAETGCPKTKLTNGRKLFSKAPLENYIYSHDNNKKVNATDYMRPWLHIGSVAHNLQYCRKLVNDTPGSKPWPKGSYCLYIERRTCLNIEGFHLEVLTYHTTVNGSLLFFHSRSCCRSDASASSPITLPTTTPFYLLRNGNECQKVVGMDVREDILEVSTLYRSALKVLYHPHPWHDEDKTDRPLRHLCHYKPAHSETK